MLHITFQGFLKFAQALCLAVLAGVGFALDMEVANGDFLQPTILFAQNHSTKIIVGTALTIVGCRLLGWIFESESPCQRKIRSLVEEELEKLRVVSFPDLPPGEPPDNNRVTLFKRVDWLFWIWPWRGFLPWGWRMPGSGWLVIRFRTGHVTQKSQTAFLAPDDAHVNAEGVAGETWRRSAAYRVRNLPNLTGIRKSSLFKSVMLTLAAKFGYSKARLERYRSDCDLVREYAESTNVSKDYIWHRVKSRKKCPLSMCGVPIEDSKGRIWGVLVLDSSNTHESIDTDDNAFRRAFKPLVRILHKLITE